MTNDADNLCRFSSWSFAAEHPPLTSEDVHVWRAILDQSDAVTQSFHTVLAPDEVKRAEKYYFAEDRKRFVIARGVLRKLLGTYAGMKPHEVRFQYGSHGKPELVQSGSSPLCFSVSHSQTIALYAITQNREIGVDVEYLREDLASLEMAERFFSSGEFETIAALPAELRTEGFFHCWTRKEAYIKAHGGGLSLPLNRFEVSLAPGETAATLRFKDESERLRNWTLRELPAGPGYVGAVVVEGDGYRLSCWEWTDY